MNSTSKTASVQAEPNRLLLGSASDPWSWMATCPHASTMFAWSNELLSYVVAAITCKRWGCSYCGRKKIARLAQLCRQAEPTKLITLTTWTKLYETPREAFDKTRRKLGDWTRRVRKIDPKFEYMRVLEATQAGWPHYHFVARCKYIPQKTLADAWAELTGNIIVDVRKVERVGDVYWYVTKYLSKQVYVPWTNRRVSWSKKFFRERAEDKPPSLKISEKEVALIHPARFAQEELRGKTLEQVTPTLWRIVEDQPRNTPLYQRLKDAAKTASRHS